MSHSDPARPCVLIVPIKAPAIAKSRLTPLPAAQRGELARAFALDTVEVALSTRGVVAVLGVTDDFRLAAQLRSTGCEVIPDGATDGLNATLVQAAAEVLRRWPQALAVVLCADLPALVAAELGAVLDCLPEAGSAFLRDRAGAGTTLYGADAASFDPRFGPDSAAAHLATGASEIHVDAPSVRADVDDVRDLEAALLKGVGQHTRAAVDLVLTGQPEGNSEGEPPTG